MNADGTDFHWLEKHLHGRVTQVSIGRRRVSPLDLGMNGGRGGPGYIAEIVVMARDIAGIGKVKALTTRGRKTKSSSHNDTGNTEEFSRKFP
jgi:hypothetical protein